MIYQAIQGDCMSALEGEYRGKVDLVVADPPYNMAKADWDNGFNFKNMLVMISKMLRSSGTTLIFNNLDNCLLMKQIIDENADLKLKFRDLLIWDKVNPAPYTFNKVDYNQSNEWILYISKNGKRRPTYNLMVDEATASNVYHYPLYTAKQGELKHPTAKPLNLIKALILRHSDVGDLVMEPYGGGRPVYRSCRDLYRSCVSYELSSAYDFYHLNQMKS